MYGTDEDTSIQALRFTNRQDNIMRKLWQRTIVVFWWTIAIVILCSVVYGGYMLDHYRWGSCSP
jgi:hypothetical protein